jgi:hypothetical protein
MTASGMDKRWSVSGSLLDGHSSNYKNRASFTVSHKLNGGIGIPRIQKNRFESSNMMHTLSPF